MTDKLRRYIIPNIPYAFIFWAFAQRGEAYRIAPGAGAGNKLINMMQTIGPAFGTIVPDHVLDLLVGLCGAVLIRVIVWNRAKKAKKFRKDVEYGSARWGTPEDIKPFADPKFENNVILSGTELLTTNTRPKNPANARNLNAAVIGSDCPKSIC